MRKSKANTWRRLNTSFKSLTSRWKRWKKRNPILVFVGGIAIVILSYVLGIFTKNAWNIFELVRNNQAEIQKFEIQYKEYFKQIQGSPEHSFDNLEKLKNTIDPAHHLDLYIKCNLAEVVCLITIANDDTNTLNFINKAGDKLQHCIEISRNTIDKTNMKSRIKLCAGSLNLVKYFDSQNASNIDSAERFYHEALSSFTDKEDTLDIYCKAKIGLATVYSLRKKTFEASDLIYKNLLKNTELVDDPYYYSTIVINYSAYIQNRVQDSKRWKKYQDSNSEKIQKEMIATMIVETDTGICLLTKALTKFENSIGTRNEFDLNLTQFNLANLLRLKFVLQKDSILFDSIEYAYAKPLNYFKLENKSSYYYKNLLNYLQFIRNKGQFYIDLSRKSANLGPIDRINLNQRGAATIQKSLVTEGDLKNSERAQRWLYCLDYQVSCGLSYVYLTTAFNNYSVEGPNLKAFNEAKAYSKMAFENALRYSKKIKETDYNKSIIYGFLNDLNGIKVNVDLEPFPFGF